MPDYKALYLKTFNAITDADRLVSQAAMLLKVTQQECEEAHMSAPDPDIRLLDPKKQADDDTDNPGNSEPDTTPD